MSTKKKPSKKASKNLIIAELKTEIRELFKAYQDSRDEFQSQIESLKRELKSNEEVIPILEESLEELRKSSEEQFRETHGLRIKFRAEKELTCRLEADLREATEAHTKMQGVMQRLVDSKSPTTS